MHRTNIEAMYQAVESNSGFDVVIIVSSSPDQARYWQSRLEASKNTVISAKTQVISVEEDWPGGAGQLLGTLYAFQKANARIDLRQMLQNGGSIAMYHTAGKATRMAPLPAAEANNKSAIKLPRLIEINRERTALTVLEGVIFQTGIFAQSRPGRLFVFWGDQVFVPSNTVDFEGAAHAEILDIRGEIPSLEIDWECNWQNYGLIIPDACEEGALQREKQSWADLQCLIAQGIAEPNQAGSTILGKSLGCFSVSHALLIALLEEFSPELEAKQGKMDTDPHLWMPMTSTEHDFVSGGGEVSHWKRINRFKQQFLFQAQPGLKMFVDKDMGQETLWWDYGQVALYHQNFLKTLDDSFEGECLRQFYNLEKHWIRTFELDELSVTNSILLDTEAKGTIHHSILLGVKADHLNISQSVVMNSSLSRMTSQKSLVYNCIDVTEMRLSQEEVVTDVFVPSTIAGSRMRMRTHLSRNGKDDWHHVLDHNPCSFEKLRQLVADQAEAHMIAERDKWTGYYHSRSDVFDVLERSFIKPQTDNLVEAVWGGGTIEKMKGLPHSNRTVGESWECSTHPSHPSKMRLIDESQLPLSELIALMSQQILGPDVSLTFKSKLPVLFKFLDARENLSVQVHPSDEDAAKLGESDTGKSEAWLVLEAEEGALLYLGFKEDVDKTEFERDLSSPEVNIARKYLNAFEVHAGDVLVIPAGAVHAIGEGIVLAEIQQSSGLTYRVWDWNRLPQRQLHIPQAIASLNFQKTTRAEFASIPVPISDQEERLMDTPHFSVDRLKISRSHTLEANTAGSFEILTCLSGNVELTSKCSTQHLNAWESLLVPASLGHYEITALEDSLLLKSFVSPQLRDPDQPLTQGTPE